MQERYAVIFRDGSAEAAGALNVEQDRLLLHGHGASGELALEISIAELSAVRIGRHPVERLNGYQTLLLERPDLPAVQVAPFGVALLPEIADLLTSLTNRTSGTVLAVAMPLKPGCLSRARELLQEGPPVDPATFGLSSHEVYLTANEALFVFRGNDMHARVGAALRHPAVWRAGLAWQRCFAAAPQVVDPARIPLDAAPAYRWIAPVKCGD